MPTLSLVGCGILSKVARSLDALDSAKETEKQVEGEGGRE